MAATPARSSARTGSPTHADRPASAARPRQKPDLVIAGRGYDHDKHRGPLGRRGIKPLIPRRGTAQGAALGRRAGASNAASAPARLPPPAHQLGALPEIHTALLVLAARSSAGAASVIVKDPLSEPVLSGAGPDVS